MNRLCVKLKMEGKKNLFLLIGITCIFLVIFTITIDKRQFLENYTSSRSDFTPRSVELLNRKVRHLSNSLADLWCSFQQLTYTGGFCVDPKNPYMGGNHMWDLGLCQSLEALIGKRSVVDLGAGLGHYGRCFTRRQEPVLVLESEKLTGQINNDWLKIMGNHIYMPQVVHSWEGYDGAGGIERLSHGFVKQQDLTEEGMNLGRKFDWVISFEVGEHIPENYEKIYLDNLVNHACQGIVLSWAVPGQGGHHHVNNQPLEKVVEKMTAYGLVHDLAAEKQLRDNAGLPWFKRNLMVFRFKDKTICTDP